MTKKREPVEYGSYLGLEKILNSYGLTDWGERGMLTEQQASNPEKPFHGRLPLWRRLAPRGDRVK